MTHATQSQWTAHPAPHNLRLTVRCTTMLLILFVIVYGSCNWLTSQRQNRHTLYFNWELGIPLVPEMIWGYLSLFVLFLLPVFCLRQEALVLLARRIAYGIWIAGAVFLLLPAELGFARAANTDAVFSVIHALDHPHNLAPSLHVIFSGLILGALGGASPPRLRHVFGGWFVLICAAVILVHQHHLLDVFSGILVTWLVVRAVRADSPAVWPGWYPRSSRKQL
jgi:membrane-associated phospholipid phosphatase